MKSLDDAINHCKEVIENDCTSDTCKEDHKQLLNWLKELKQYKQNNINTNEIHK